MLARQDTFWERPLFGRTVAGSTPGAYAASWCEAAFDRPSQLLIDPNVNLAGALTPDWIAFRFFIEATL
jgi:hypothetical protein